MGCSLTAPQTVLARVEAFQQRSAEAKKKRQTKVVTAIFHVNVTLLGQAVRYTSFHCVLTL